MDMSGHSLQGRKTAEAEKNAPRPYREKRGPPKQKQNCRFEKLFFCWLGKKIVGWQKKIRFEEKMSVGEFPLPKRPWKYPDIPCKTEQRQRRKNKPLGPKGKKKPGGFFFCWLGKKIVGWKNNNKAE